MRIFYNVGLSLLFLAYFPKLFSKKGRSKLWARIKNFKRLREVPLVWVHAVSLGEAKAVSALIHAIHADYPQAQIVFSTATRTGLDHGREEFPYAETHFLLPFDFYWNAKRLVEQLQPTLFIQVETDFWFNLLHELKQKGAHIALVNGKMSEKSAKRHRLFPYFGRLLLAHFDLIALQSDDYKEAFGRLTSQPLALTGNLKLDQPVREVEGQFFREKWGLTKRIITIGSTHEGEERLLLNSLKGLKEVQIILAPRHPERFKEVKQLLKELGFNYGCVSRNEPCSELLLVDVMGALASFYSISDVAIVGGSFVPKIGGHNIFEPMAYGVATLFGPYMHNQKAFVERALSAQGAAQIEADELMAALSNESKLKKIGERGREIFLKSQGATAKTYALLRPFLDNSLP